MNDGSRSKPRNLLSTKDVHYKYPRKIEEITHRMEVVNVLRVVINQHEVI